VLREEDGERLLECDSEQSLSESDSETEHELEDRALTDTLGNDGSDEDDDSGPPDFVWENMDNYRAQRKTFTGSTGVQGAAKDVIQIVDIFELFFNQELILRGRELSGRLLGHRNL
jgi:hypothetical protein